MTALFTGCTFTSSLLFVNVVGVGDCVAVFAGNAVFTGCAWTVGWRIDLYTHKYTGCNDVSTAGDVSTQTTNHPISPLPTLKQFNCALVAGYGVGFMIFVGGGTVIFTGVSGANNMGANAFFGSG